MKKFLTFALSLTTLFGSAQTVIQTGNWDETTTWQSGNIADVVTENVAFNSSPLTVTVESGNNYTVGNVALASNGHLNVEGTLNIGNSSNARNLTGNASRFITISGSLTIWGDLNLGDGSVITGSGSLIVKGNVTLGNSVTITNSGTFTVGGNFTGGTSTAVITSSPITITGDIVVGNSSSLTKSIGVTVSARSCTGPAAFCNNVLPVKLVSFVSTEHDSGITLMWTTTMEKNFDRFEIHRASNGTDFQAIGTLPGRGNDLNAIENSYIFEDRVPYNGRNYYRLKMIDLDGYFDYSRIIMSEWQSDRKILVWPNPSSGDVLHLQVNFISKPGDLIRAYNVFGQRVFEVSATQIHSISMEAFPPGTYILEYSTGFHHHNTKFTIK